MDSDRPTAIDFRVAYTRIAYSVEHDLDFEDEDVVSLYLFAEHMRSALARICDQDTTADEAKRIAKAARMGENF